MSNSLRPHGLQHARLPCPSLSPRVCSNSCPLSWRCHPTMSMLRKSNIVVLFFLLKTMPPSAFSLLYPAQEALSSRLSLTLIWLLVYSNLLYFRVSPHSRHFPLTYFQFIVKHRPLKYFVQYLRLTCEMNITLGPVSSIIFHGVGLLWPSFSIISSMFEWLSWYPPWAAFLPVPTWQWLCTACVTVTKQA